MAISDVKNFNKIYKPKSEQMKNSWKEAVLLAQHMEALDPRERLKRCELSRLEDRGGKALIKKYENDQKHEEQQQQRSGGSKQPADQEVVSPRSSLTSPVMSPKKNSSPGSAETHRKSTGSGHYNRRDEMDYKMHRLSEGGQARKRKISLSEEKAAARPRPVMPLLFEGAKGAPTFNKSFKIKKDKPSQGADPDSPAKNLKGEETVAGRETLSPEKNSFKEKKEVDEEKDTVKKIAKVEKIESKEENWPEKDRASTVSPSTPESVPKKEAIVENKEISAEKKKGSRVLKGPSEDDSNAREDSGSSVAYEPGEGALGRPQWSFLRISFYDTVRLELDKKHLSGSDPVFFVCPVNVQYHFRN
jgi:hypothetical protein